MAKKPNRRRSAFPNVERRTDPEPQESFVSGIGMGGVFGFFRDVGVRETIESIIVAIVLALMFRAYEAEAFIIPTGSMAPSLQGQHMDLECEQCGFQCRAEASKEAPSSADRDTVSRVYCPICLYETKIDRRKNRNHKSNNGDRILVNKFVYDFQEPERYDVIVFKNPNNGKQNYIKRLIGLPGDNILIENGDVYVLEDLGSGKYGKRITRKSAEKLRHVLQVVDDTDHVGKKLAKVSWPSRWQSFDGIGNWKPNFRNEKWIFESAESSGENWLRYRHFQPHKSDWSTILDDELPERYRNRLPAGQLIDDKYGYNDLIYRNDKKEVFRGNQRGWEDVSAEDVNRGTHWVGDIGLECQVEIQSTSGKLLLDLVEGGAHLICEIDVATGKATLRCDDSTVETKVTFRDSADKEVSQPSGQTRIQGPGKYRIEFVNADDRLNLWVNNKLIEFDGAEFTRTGIPVPTYQTNNPGDAEPAGIATNGLKATVTNLKIVRDIYYTSLQGYVNRGRGDNETGNDDVVKIEELQANPEAWSSPEAVAFFQLKKGRFKPMFKLEKGAKAEQDQFLPMGDNSPRSLDGRIWNGKNYVERDMLIGRAMMIYWPHTLNEPIPYFPNFGKMGFIR
ncbi:MAG: signal peptidase I [Mariniblastus sp.]|jgi:signal peptidase I